MPTTHSLINQLIQLQELIAAKMQKKVSMQNARIDELEKSITALSADLSNPIKSHINRLLQKNPEAIVPVVNGNCTGCGMALTKSLMQSIMKAEDINRCPNCTRFLFHPTEVVERTRITRQYNDIQKTGIERYTSPELMIMPLKGKNSEEIMGELCTRMADHGFAQNPELLTDLALQREAIVSTAVDNGLAFPHVRGVEGGGLAMAVGISKKGIRFDPSRRILTRIFFFVVIPRATSAFYLKLISQISRTFRDRDAREHLINATDEKELWKFFIKTTKKTLNS